jgi:hypothetical protein
MRAIRKSPVLLVALVLALVVPAAPAVAAPAAPASLVPFGSRLAYLSLGDSLAAGVQADADGDSVLTDRGTPTSSTGGSRGRCPACATSSSAARVRPPRRC